MMAFRPLLLLSLALAGSELQADNVVPLKPGGQFDYSKFAFQPESWKTAGPQFATDPLDRHERCFPDHEGHALTRA